MANFLQDDKFITVSFETANNNMNSACAVAIAVIENLKIVNTQHHLIKPPNMQFSMRNVKSHKITPEMVENEPEFPTVFAKIAKYFNCEYLVLAYNSDINMKILASCLCTYGLKVSFMPFCDIVNVSKNYRKISYKKLLKLAESLNVLPSKNEHKALSEVITSAEIVIEVVKKLRYMSLIDFIKHNDCPLNNILYIEPDVYNDVPEDFKPYIQKNAKNSNSQTTKSKIIVQEQNKKHIFYNKVFVFTGETQELTKMEAMKRISELGGVIKGSITSETDYLLVGKQDPELVFDDGLSLKEKKAEQLIKEGKNIAVLNESKFLELLTKY